MYQNEREQQGGGILRFLGRGAAFNPALGNTSAYVREGDRLLLLDCGESVFERLVARGVLDGVREAYFAVSHLHSDHCGSLGTTVLYCRERLGAKVFMLLPPGEEAYAASVRQLLSLFGVAEDDYEVMDPARMPAFQAFSSLRYARTVHSPGMTCFSFVLETPQGGVFYSADSHTTDALEAFLRTHDQVAMIYMETTDQDIPGGVHLPLSRLQAVLTPELAARTRLMHLGSSRCIDMAKEAGFQIVSAEE